ncbi:MAG: DNA helicase UvrC [Lachnospiraceae bacterium]|nr:DNA helicase UvrC [Lachnospiraceae bacterium]
MEENELTLKEKLKSLPSCPGVYLMKGSDQNIIYVGKSKNLKSRVTTYFHSPDPDDKKAMKLYHSIKDLDIITTDTELEALLLECRLIHKYKPWCNRLMKNPDSYVYLKLTMAEDYPDLFLCDETKEDGSLYFGPYHKRSTTQHALDAIRDLYKMACTKNNRKSTSCINYSLGKCNGICLGKISIELYRKQIQEIIDFLMGTTTTLLNGLEEKMSEASAAFEFEQAAKLRNQIAALSTLTRQAKLISFASSHPLLLVAETLSLEYSKVLLLNGTAIIFEKKFVLDPKLKSSTLKKIAADVFDSLPKEEKKVQLSKQEIDEFHIIFSYLDNQQNDCRYYNFKDLEDEALNARVLYKILKGLF